MTRQRVNYRRVFSAQCRLSWFVSWERGSLRALLVEGSTNRRTESESCWNRPIPLLFRRCLVVYACMYVWFEGVHVEVYRVVSRKSNGCTLIRRRRRPMLRSIMWVIGDWCLVCMFVGRRREPTAANPLGSFLLSRPGRAGGRSNYCCRSVAEPPHHCYKHCGSCRRQPAADKIPGSR